MVNDIGTSLSGEGRDTSAADGVVAEIKAAGGNAIANYEDITDWDAAKRIVDAALDAFGDLHVVVNNAGIVRDRMFVSATLEEWDATMHVHLRGHFCLARHAVNYWREKQKGGSKSRRADHQHFVGRRAFRAASRKPPTRRPRAELPRSPWCRRRSWGVMALPPTRSLHRRARG